MELYDPDRSRWVIDRTSGSDKQASWADFNQAFTSALNGQMSNQGDGMAILSQAMSGPKGVAAELGLQPWQRGYVFGAFAIAYALFEMPGGWMGDWLGPRKVLLRVVIWWSSFTAITGLVWNFGSLVVKSA